MKNYSRKRNRKPFLIVIPIAMLLIGASLFVLERTGVTDFYSQPVADEQSQQGVVAGAKPTNTVDYGEAKSEDNFTVPDKDPEPPTPESVNLDLGAIITSTRISTTGSDYLIKVAVSGTTGGTCEAIMSQGAQVLTSSTDISLLAGQYGCTSLKIPMYNLASKGSWNVQVTVTDSNGASVVTSTEVIL